MLLLEVWRVVLILSLTLPESVLTRPSAPEFMGRSLYTVQVLRRLASASPARLEPTSLGQVGPLQRDYEGCALCSCIWRHAKLL